MDYTKTESIQHKRESINESKETLSPQVSSTGTPSSPRKVNSQNKRKKPKHKKPPKGEKPNNRVPTQSYFLQKFEPEADPDAELRQLLTKYETKRAAVRKTRKFLTGKQKSIQIGDPEKTVMHPFNTMKLISDNGQLKVAYDVGHRPSHAEVMELEEINRPLKSSSVQDLYFKPGYQSPFVDTEEEEIDDKDSEFYRRAYVEYERKRIENSLLYKIFFCIKPELPVYYKKNIDDESVGSINGYDFLAQSTYAEGSRDSQESYKQSSVAEKIKLSKERISLSQKPGKTSFQEISDNDIEQNIPEEITRKSKVFRKSTKVSQPVAQSSPRPISRLFAKRAESLTTVGSPKAEKIKKHKQVKRKPSKAKKKVRVSQNSIPPVQTTQLIPSVKEPEVEEEVIKPIEEQPRKPISSNKIFAFLQTGVLPEKKKEKKKESIHKQPVEATFRPFSIYANAKKNLSKKESSIVEDTPKSLEQTRRKKKTFMGVLGLTQKKFDLDEAYEEMKRKPQAKNKLLAFVAEQKQLEKEVSKPVEIQVQEEQVDHSHDYLDFEITIHKPAESGLERFITLECSLCENEIKKGDSKVVERIAKEQSRSFHTNCVRCDICRKVVGGDRCIQLKEEKKPMLCIPCDLNVSKAKEQKIKGATEIIRGNKDEKITDFKKKGLIKEGIVRYVQVEIGDELTKKMISMIPLCSVCGLQLLGDNSDLMFIGLSPQHRTCPPLEEIQKRKAADIRRVILGLPEFIPLKLFFKIEETVVGKTFFMMKDEASTMEALQKSLNEDEILSVSYELEESKRSQFLNLGESTVSDVDLAVEIKMDMGPFTNGETLTTIQSVKDNYIMLTGTIENGLLYQSKCIVKLFEEEQALQLEKFCLSFSVPKNSVV
eukprot:snap_masked-scaffold_58-processed-gene-0.64-mRNA-1 protein AED:1.00 eAED:1.00 QI:0/-1/0/0/-1/1/1/0/880